MWGAGVWWWWRGVPWIGLCLCGNLYSSAPINPLAQAFKYKLEQWIWAIYFVVAYFWTCYCVQKMPHTVKTYFSFSFMFSDNTKRIYLRKLKRKQVKSRSLKSSWVIWISVWKQTTIRQYKTAVGRLNFIGTTDSSQNILYYLKVYVTTFD